MDPKCNCNVCSTVRRIRDSNNKEISLLVELAVYTYVAKNLIPDVVTALPEEAFREYVALQMQKSIIDEDKFNDLVNELLDAMKLAIKEIKDANFIKVKTLLH